MLFSVIQCGTTACRDLVTMTTTTMTMLMTTMMRMTSTSRTLNLSLVQSFNCRHRVYTSRTIWLSELSSIEVLVINLRLILVKVLNWHTGRFIISCRYSKDWIHNGKKLRNWRYYSNITYIDNNINIFQYEM